METLKKQIEKSFERGTHFSTAYGREAYRSDQKMLMDAILKLAEQIDNMQR